MPSDELAKIEKLGQELTDDVKEKVNTELAKFANKVVDVFRDVIRREKLEASHSLAQSIEPKIIDGEVHILANSYYKYVDKGVSGTKLKRPNTPYSYSTKRPPLRAFENWLNFKGEGGDKSRAYAMREAVFQRGIRGRGFVRKSIRIIDKMEV